MNRRSFLVWHRRLGLAVLPLVALQALSGLVLVAALVTRGDGPPHPVGPPSHMVAQAQAAAPGFVVFRLDYPASGPIQARMTNAQGATAYALLDAADGHVLRAGSIWHFPLRMAQEWHYALMAGRVGGALVVAEAVALMLLAAMGLAFWWPGAAHIRRGLAIPARTPQRLKLRLWHRSTGIIASGLLVFWAGTGLLLALPALSAPSPAPIRPALPLDRAWPVARSALPGQPLRDIRVAPDGTATFHFAAPGPNHWALDTVVPQVSQPPRITRAAQADALWMRLLPLHTGDALGTGGLLFAAIFAATLLFLCASGTIAWHKQRPNKGKARP
jgi:uncharacterized iron-regulated membrane protein